jgi:shikimate kinase
MALCEKILIVGFSGTGKSTLLKRIESSAPTPWDHFDDLDGLILKFHGKNQRDLSSLIEKVGWDQFRLWERQTLEGWLKEEGKGVLSLGGGALSPMIFELYKNSRKLKFCHLWASFETCWQRLIDSDEIRPMLKRGQLEFKKVYEQRMIIFNQVQWRLENEAGQDMEELAKLFWKEVEK